MLSKGLPAKRYIKINEKKLFDAVSNKKLKNLTSGEISSNKKSIKSTSRAISQKNELEKNDADGVNLCPTRSEKINQLEVKNFTLNKNKEIKIKNNKKERKEGRKQTEKSKMNVNEELNFTGEEKSSPELIGINKDVNNPINKNVKRVIEKNSPGKETKKSLTENTSTVKTFNEQIESYTENIKLQEELKEHLKVRKLKKAALTNRAIELSLKKLSDLTNNDEEKILIVQNSIMNGWTTFYPLKPDEKNRLNNKSSYNINEYEKTMDTFLDEGPPKWHGKTLGLWL